MSAHWRTVYKVCLTNALIIIIIIIIIIIVIVETLSSV